MCQFSEAEQRKIEVDQIARDLLKTVEENYQPTHEYVAADLRDFKHLDRKYYERTTTWLESEQFRFLADEEDVTLANTSGNVLRPVLIRTLISDDGHIQASLYHPRLKFWTAVLLFFFRVKMTKVIDLETEFSDGAFLVTSNAGAAAAPMQTPPSVRTSYLPQTAPPKAVLESHRARLREHLASNPGVRPVAIHDLAGLRASQNRLNVIKSAYRGEIGGISAQELEKCGMKDPAMAAEVHERIRELQAERTAAAASSSTFSSTAQS